MKRILSLLLIAAMIFSLAVPVQAVDGGTDSTSYKTVLTLVNNGAGLLTGNDFTERAAYGESGFVISATKNANETETFLKAFTVPGARMVLKYRISGEQAGTWFNWLQTNVGFCIPSWHGDKSVIFKNADGSAHGNTVSEGEHIVYADCAEYISMYTAETNTDFYNSFSSFGFQSGASGFYFEEMTIEVPAETNFDDVNIPGRASGTVTFYSTVENAWETPTIVSTTGKITNGNWNRLLDITGLVTAAAGTDLSKVTDINVTVEALGSDSFPSRIGDYWDCVEVRAMVSGTADPVKLIGSRANKEAITGNVVTMKQYLTNGTEGIFIHLQDYAAIDETTPVTFKITVAATTSETGPQPLTLKKYDDGTHAEFARYTPYIVLEGYGTTVVDSTTNMSIEDFNAAINKSGAKLIIDASYSGWMGNYWFEFALPNGEKKNVIVGADKIRDTYNHELTCADLLGFLTAETTVPDDYVVTLNNIKRHSGNTTLYRFEVVVPDPAETPVMIRSIFNDKIALEYKVDLPSTVVDPVMQFTVNGVTTTANGSTTAYGEEPMPMLLADTDTTTWYFIFDGVIPADLAAPITARVVDSVVEIPTVSVLDYCNDRLTDSADTTFKQLVSELVRYASSASKLNGGNEITLDNLLPVKTGTAYENKFKYNKIDGLWKGATLVLDNVVTMRIYYNKDALGNERLSVGEHLYETDSHPFTINEDKGYIEITGFTPLDYNETIILNYRGEYINYSVGTYISRMSVNGTDLTKEICTNLQNYGRAAEAYALASGQN